jgi:ADP-heptose:LPS heptosyltransferase
VSKFQKIDIVLPNRIGDSIMILPALVCLKQLNEKHGTNYQIRMISTNPMTEIYKELNIFPVRKMGLLLKLKSLLFQSDKAFFLESSSKNMFFRAKKTYGIVNPFKKYLKYDVDIPFIAVDRTEEFIDKDLISFMRDKYGLSTLPISFMGILPHLGFSTEQIIETFDFNKNSLKFPENFSKTVDPKINGKYFVFCMEAAYGKKQDNDRRWGGDNYLKMAENVYQKYGVKSVFIGIDNNPELPDKDYLIDLRKKVSLLQLAKICVNSLGYIGNDTGPLHLANLAQKPSFGIYMRKTTIKNYSPIFPHLNTVIFNPENCEKINFEFEKFLNANIPTAS